MSFQCSICWDNLSDSNSNPAASLGCGHVYHGTCIMKWMTQSTSNGDPNKCPNCKQKISKTKIISRLFFSASSNDDPDDTSNETSNEELLEEVRQLKDNNDKMSMKLVVANSKLEEHTLKIVALEEELSHALHGKRYLKQIRKVAELDDDVSSERSMRYLDELKRISHQELKVHASALRERQLKAAKEKNDMEKRLEEMQLRLNKIEQENLHLTNKCSRYKAKFLNSQISTVVPSTSTSTAAIDHTLPDTEKSSGVIVLDDSDNDDEDEGTDLATRSRSRTPRQQVFLDDEAGLDEDEVQIQNYNPMTMPPTSMRLKRLLFTNNSFGGSKRRKPSAFTINLDDDDNTTSSEYTSSSSRISHCA